MYSKFYSFSHNPFELTPDPDVIFLSETHQEAISVLRYGVINQKGFLQLTGKVGTGKSTLLQSLIQSLESNVHLCYIPNPNFTVQEFYYFLAAKFGLEAFDGNKAKFIISLGKFLQQCKKENKHVLLIVDEAQVLSLDVLEEIRLISNQEFHEVFGVLSIFLVGQPEFNDLLDHQKLLPLRNRIGIRFQIEPLTLAETTAYVQFRLRKAGRKTPLFSQIAYQAIHRITGGIPRSINILCDNALLAGFAEQKGIIDAEIIRDCARELRQTEAEASIPENKSAEIKDKRNVSKVITIRDENQKPNTSLKLQKVAMAVVALFILFLAIGTTTEYWGRLPGTTPLKAFFEKLHVNENFLSPIKKIFIGNKDKAEFSSVENRQITEPIAAPTRQTENVVITDQHLLPQDVEAPPGLPEEKINAKGSITDKKKLLLTQRGQASLKAIPLLKILRQEELGAAPILPA